MEPQKSYALEQGYTVFIIILHSKKNERLRSGLAANGIRGIDAILITRELACMICQAEMDVTKLIKGNATVLWANRQVERPYWVCLTALEHFNFEKV